MSSHRSVSVNRRWQEGWQEPPAPEGSYNGFHLSIAVPLQPPCAHLPESGGSSALGQCDDVSRVFPGGLAKNPTPLALVGAPNFPYQIPLHFQLLEVFLAVKENRSFIKHGLMKIRNK